MSPNPLAIAYMRLHNKYIIECWRVFFEKQKRSSDLGARLLAEKFFAFLEKVKTASPGTWVELDGVTRDGIPFGAMIDPDFGPRICALGFQSEESAPPSAPQTSMFFLDDAEWTDAVACQGVRIPIGDEYYQSTHWKILRHELITGRCAMCQRRNVPTTLHHRNYDRMGQETADDLTEVCRICHAHHHYHGELGRAA